MILDTTFLIDLHREFQRRSEGPAQCFLSAHEETPFQISVISVIEFLEGFNPVASGERYLRNLPWIEVNSEIARKAAEYRRQLRVRGQMIGDFDLLIGGTAVVHGLPLVTGNGEHFRRLNGLEVIDYRNWGPA